MDAVAIGSILAVAFSILIVVYLAIKAVKLINSSPGEKK